MSGNIGSAASLISMGRASIHLSRFGRMVGHFCFFSLSPSEHFIFTRDTHLSSSRVARTDDFLIQETRNIRHEKENGIVHRKRRYTAVVLSAGKSVSAPELSWRVVSVEEATLRSRPACVSLCL